METTKQEQPVTDQDKFVRGLYRNIGELARAVNHLAIALDRSFGPVNVEVKNAKPAPDAEPTQATLDLEPGSIARTIAAEPPKWGNAVKFYQALWCKCGCCTFDVAELVENGNIREAIRQETNGKIGVASYSRVLSTLHRAGAVSKVGRRGYAANPPTPEILAAVERVAKKRKEAAA